MNADLFKFIRCNYIKPVPFFYNPDLLQASTPCIFNISLTLSTGFIVMVTVALAGVPSGRKIVNFWSTFSILPLKLNLPQLKGLWADPLIVSRNLSEVTIPLSFLSRGSFF